jgi:hypothetical protein
MPSPHLHRKLLWIDCGAALLAGVAVLSLSTWLSQLYAIPRGLVVATGVANLAYGTFSLSLARRARRPRSLIVLLVMANAAWVVVCALAAVLLAGTASAFGLAHLIGEGLFVGGLAALEWNERERLLGATPTPSSYAVTADER